MMVSLACAGEILAYSVSLEAFNTVVLKNNEPILNKKKMRIKDEFFIELDLQISNTNVYNKKLFHLRYA